MIIRPATYQDSDDLFAWRNDAQTRAMSITSDEVKRSDHDRWYSATLSNPNRVLLIGEVDNKKIGMCRFDIDEDTACVSINLNPLVRGKGMATPFLQKAIDTFWDEYQCDLTATIKHDNIASMKCFEHVGVIQDRSDEIFHYYILKYAEGAS
jgi:RimJ/RimL family protein N-acetyltransferase